MPPSGVGGTASTPSMLSQVDECDEEDDGGASGGQRRLSGAARLKRSGSAGGDASGRPSGQPFVGSSKVDSASGSLMDIAEAYRSQRPRRGSNDAVGGHNADGSAVGGGYGDISGGRRAGPNATASRGCKTPPLLISPATGGREDFDVEKRFQQDMSAALSQRAPPSSAAILRQSPGLAVAPQLSVKGGRAVLPRHTAVASRSWLAKGQDQLSVQKGASVDVFDVNGQWAWCRDSLSQGWVPQMYLTLEGNDSARGRGDATPTAVGQSGVARGEHSPRVSNEAVATDAGRVPRKRRSPTSRKRPGHLSPAPGEKPRDGGGAQGAGAGLRPARAGSDSVDGAVKETPAPPQKWSTRLKDTMVLHTVNNAMRLAHYLLQLLTDGYGTVSALHIACWEGSVGAVSALVSGNKTMVKDWHSRPGELTPMHIAVLCGHVGVLENLLQYDADPDVPTVHGLRALHIAASSNHEIVEVLLAGRADLSAVTADADTPLHFACCYHQVQTIELLLKAATVTSPSLASTENAFGVVPLHLAAAYSALEGVVVSSTRDLLLLCSHRADPTAVDRHGRSPADVAIMAGGDPTVAEFLQGKIEGRLGTLGTLGAEAETVANRVHRVSCELLSIADAAEAAALAADAAERDRDGASRTEDDRGASLSSSGLPPRPSSASRPVVGRTGDLQLAEENTMLAAEVLKLGKELEATRANQKLTMEMLEHTKGIVEQMKAFSAESQAQDGEDLKQFRDELEKERAELRERNEALEAERQRLNAENDAARAQQEEELKRFRDELPRLRKQLAEEQEVARRIAAEALTERAAAVEASKEAIASAAAEAAAAATAATQEEQLRRMPSRPSTAIAQKEAELTEKDALLNDKGAELANLQAHLDKALAELSSKTEELTALRDDQDKRNAVAMALSEELANARREAERRYAEIADACQAQKRVVAERDGARAEATRLDAELKKQTILREETWAALSELRKQQTELREEHARLRLATKEGEMASKTREATLLAENHEKDLKLQKMEQDVAEISAKLRELEGCRERAERADRMLQPLENRIQELHVAFNEEQGQRKRYHNQLQDLKGAIRVYARIRPVVEREKDEEVALRKLDAFQLELDQGFDRQGKPKGAKAFMFDSIFDEQATQEDVFAECRGLASSAIDGYNVTVFAYGQTGAGKTHTMYGGLETPGLVPRLARELFNLLDRYAHDSQATLRCSMFELYRDDLLDLLLPKVKGKNPVALDIKKDSRGSVFVDHGTEREVCSCDELLRTISEGIDRRHVSATKMNSESSRSHLICIIVVESTSRKTKQVATGKLTLCDLAGSERIKKSEVSGEAMKEAQSINKSLTALGDVIEALTKNAKHIPYRNHKLTQLLSDSIGGNAKTLMFVNCSPVASNADETNSSLSYAARAKMIVNKVEKNQDSQEVARLKKVVQVMSQELEQARANIGGATGALPPQNMPNDAPATSASGPEAA
eukprot:TRINITY_DN29244_c0_g1_i1.p1 TRINITY_DN29244_c0_g1~~TRINITY_DN29244_c0_g1_i1.p1  ORF type:complete len:1506 (+),score=343.92 TRINITY_DN29244_c0_g1_i1:114-4520(+)